MTFELSVILAFQSNLRWMATPLESDQFSSSQLYIDVKESGIWYLDYEDGSDVFGKKFAVVFSREDANGRPTFFLLDASLQKNDGDDDGEDGGYTPRGVIYVSRYVKTLMVCFVLGHCYNDCVDKKTRMYNRLRKYLCVCESTRLQDFAAMAINRYEKQRRCKYDIPPHLKMLVNAFSTVPVVPS